MSYVVRFTDPDAAEHALVGGKAANLGRLAGVGLAVPPGFTVSTRAHAEFLAATGLDAEIGARLERIDHADAASVEEVCAAIRALTDDASVPEPVAHAVAAAYSELAGGDAQTAVAVRSSGTAEDLAAASFAGLHDTFLEISGLDAVLDAISRCWASLWTARATAYRHDRGFDQRAARLAVVVQRMLPAEAAGVMFTANPLSGAVDETVVNASWGLGEAVVSGLVTPDEYVLDRDTLRVRRRALGSKDVRIVRDPSGSGTVTEPVPEAERSSFTLEDDRAAELGLLGRRVTELYDGFPQDVEWALADGTIHLLQARPLTGVELSWDEDLEVFHTGGEPEDAVYTRAWSDDFSIAAVTPLYYTTRSKEWSDCYRTAQQLYGHEDVARIRSWKYHKGEAYFSSAMEAAWTAKILPPYLRVGGALNKIPPSRWAEVQAAPFSWADFAKVFARIELLHGRSGWFRYVEAFQERIDRPEEARGLSDGELRALPDRELQAHLRHRLDLWKAADDDQWAAFFLFAPFAMGTMAHLLVKWYDGDIAQAFADLLSGLPEPSITLRENHEIWEFGERIKGSPLLRRLLDEHAGAAFFAALAEHEEGREFLAEYEPWRVRRGHRGAADRDFSLPRRMDDPSIDYNAFRALMAGEGNDPLLQEAEHRRKRAQREADVYAAIRAQPLGAAKAAWFRVLQDWALRFMAHRDDEREYLDVLAYAQRRCFQEMGRRLAERGLFEAPEDVFFLGLEENFALLDGAASPALCRAKIEGRRRNFLRRQRGEVTLPPYLTPDGTPALPGELIGMISAEDTSEQDGRTVLAGVGTSGGTASGRARVLRHMSEIGTLEAGDILVCHATDPGWTPVFLVIGGLVMASGGVLAHGSCLSREYGLPAIVVPEAMSRIEDGATVTVDGDLGQLTIDGAPAAALEGAR